MKKIQHIKDSSNKDLSKEDQYLIDNYSKLLFKENELKKTIEKINKKKSKIKKHYLALRDKRKQLSDKIKSINNKLFITTSIVFDKRWKTYICILKNSKSQKSIYIGKHDLVINCLAQYYQKDKLNDSIDSIKSELKKIITSIQRKIISINDENEIIIKVKKFEKIIKLYEESGNWEYWTIKN